MPPVAQSEGREAGVVPVLTYLTIAQEWNVLAGFSGQVSLGAAAFMATGGYTTALILVHTGLPWPVALLGAGVGAGPLALLLAVPLLRLRGDYFAVGTLAVSVAVQALLSNWKWAGGAGGLTLPTERIPSGGNLYQIAVLVAALAMALALYVRHSAFGLRLTAVRDNEPAAAGLGVSVHRHRLAALVPTSTLTGLAGAVIAFQFVVISPDGVASVNWSLNAVLMTVVGGAGTVLGPVVGVGVVYYGLTRALQDQQTLSMVIEGVLLIAIVRFAPQGAWPLISRAVRLPCVRHRTPTPDADIASTAIPRTPEHA
ncbi:branched-chain amino acid ABC transporter permease [Streptomyces fuscichromogenes]|uniref:Branched-chain amino acid ABC transporter permease n=1 Tax=Streptomyces fuscichromogenes TaxID=1324013 RepID=A0A917XAC1_9ACTN|nr:branched-chain amino acid ABC transporter permease [Streptomyces fuscichromogenes]GGN00805.1 branched-chain amino acid ABC transporter permease [Streptomyces fuscichromogenes]